MAGAYHDSAKLIGLVALILVLTIPVWAVITPYLAESFRTEIRSCGYGISYSLATILPGFYSFYMLGLAKTHALSVQPDRAARPGGADAQSRRPRWPRNQARGFQPIGSCRNKLMGLVDEYSIKY